MTKGELLARLENVGDATELTVIVADNVRYSLQSDVMLFSVDQPTEHVIAQLYIAELKP